MEYILLKLLKLFKKTLSIPRIIFFSIARIYFSKIVGSHGDNFQFGRFIRVLKPKTLTVGDNVFIGEKTYIAAETEIGNCVMLGPMVTILSGNHKFAVKGRSVRFLKHEPNYKPGKVKINDDSWIGANVTILGPLDIGHGSIVGACSFVNKDLAPFTIYAGNPCRAIRKIFDDDVLYLHLVSLGYSKSYSKDLVKKRVSMLYETELQVVDKTSQYWEEINAN